MSGCGSRFRVTGVILGHCLNIALNSEKGVMLGLILGLGVRDIGCIKAKFPWRKILQRPGI